MFGRKVLNKYVGIALEAIKVFKKPCYMVLEREDDLNREALRKKIEELLNDRGHCRVSGGQFGGAHHEPLEKIF